MIPTRKQIADKLTELKETVHFQNLKKQAVSDWLDVEGCPQGDKEKILDDLNSYPEYAE